MLKDRQKCGWQPFRSCRWNPELLIWYSLYVATICALYTANLPNIFFEGDIVVISWNNTVYARENREKLLFLDYRKWLVLGKILEAWKSQQHWIWSELVEQQMGFWNWNYFVTKTARGCRFGIKTLLGCFKYSLNWKVLNMLEFRKTYSTT